MQFSKRIVCMYTCLFFVCLFILVLATPVVWAGGVVVLEHKENFIVYSTTKGVVLNGSISGYNLSDGDLIRVSWVAEEDPLLVPPAIFLFTEEQWAHYSHATGPVPPWDYLVKEIAWVGDFQYHISSNGTYFVVIHNINWPALGWIGPTINMSTYDAVLLVPFGPTALLSALPTTLYEGDNVHFDASASQPGSNGTHTMSITEYRWDFDGDNVIDLTTTESTITHSYLVSGTYYAKVTVYAPGASPESDISEAVKITVEKLPSPVPPSPAVGGKATPINISTNKPEFPAFWIWLTILLPLAATTIFVKLKKKKQ